MAITALDFPEPRLIRTGGRLSPSVPTGAAPANPRVRVFPYFMRELANTRHTISTPQLRGAVLVKGFCWASGSAADPPNETIEIGFARFPVSENSVALATNRPYTPLVELIDPFNLVANDRGQGFPQTTVNSPQRGTYIPLNLVVPDAECVITISVVNPSAFAQSYVGYIHLIENIPVDQLASFL